MEKDLTNRIFFIGDLHGLDTWKEEAEEALRQYYEIVFLGDYVDSFHVKAAEQMYNLKEICAFVRKNKKHVTALLGNHDYAYIYGIDGISGKQYDHAFEYKKIFDDNLDLFQIAWGYTNKKTKKYTLATHAGLTKQFYKKYVTPEIKEGELIHETLNGLQDKKDIIWKVGDWRGGRGTPGPLWADYNEILEDPYTGINQVFGHTPQITPRLDYFGEHFIACIDNWGNKKMVSMLIDL
jgi:predicted MPP superfamily phosphohydrolase